MNDAYKRQGYTISVKDSAGEDEYVIQDPGWWMVRMMQKDIPRQILATIVLHLGKLPEAGESYQVQKDANQTEIHDMANIAFMDAKTDPDNAVQIKPTGLHWKDCHLWQRSGDNAIVMMPPKYEKILDSHGRKVFMHGSNVISLSGFVSSAFVKALPTDICDIDKMDHLAGIRWVPED